MLSGERPGKRVQRTFKEKRRVSDFWTRAVSISGASSPDFGKQIPMKIGVEHKDEPDAIGVDLLSLQAICELDDLRGCC